jgi:hypothetical protein
MAVLNLKEDWKVSKVRQSISLLRNKKALARGSRSAIFEGRAPDRLLKLMADTPGYLYLTDRYAPKGPHTPVIHEDFGIVGETQAGETLYLVEVEKLIHRPRAHPSNRILKKAYGISFAARMGRWGSGVPSNLPEDPEEYPWLPPSLAEFFGELNQFVVDMQVSLDYNIGKNYLLRANGELVANDPVFELAKHERWACSFF